MPITWPVTPYYSPGDATIDVTTGVGYPKKANDARANPKVSLLFSEPHGSGIDDAPMVLVQGTAEVDDRDLDANADRYARESPVKLPAREEPDAAEVRSSGTMGWYFKRLYVKVRPERVYVWAGGDIGAEPRLLDTRLEEVRSAHAEEPEDVEPGRRRGEGVWDDRMDQLGDRYDTAVLSVAGAGRLPVLGARAGGRRPPARAACASRPTRWAPRCAPGGRAWPRTTTASASSGSATSRSAATSSRTATAGRSSPRKLVGGFELPPGELRADQRRTPEDAALPQDREARAGRDRVPPGLISP